MIRPYRLPRLFSAVSVLTLASLTVLAACGGDTQDRLDLADPAMRFVHAAPLLPALTLYRGEAAQADATGVSYASVSNYFDISTDNADWTVKTAAGVAVIGTLPVNPSRGNKYTLVALPAAAGQPGVILFSDPYNKSLNSDQARIRLVNAAGNTTSVDVYVSAPGADISAAGVTPTIAATAFRAVGPSSGQDSIEIPAGSYRLTITQAGAKTVLFSGALALPTNKDILLLTVPSAGAGSLVKVLYKQEGTPGATELPAN